MIKISYFLKLFLLIVRLVVLKFFTNEYNKEINYIFKKLPSHGNYIAPICMFPFEKQNKVDDIVADIDNNLNLPYVIHLEKRLYFPQSYSIDKAVKVYRNFIEEECILGGNYKEKQPHQYQTESFKINRGDVLVDVGCAEAILTLDNIDKISKAYLFEGDPKWLPALKATFQKYSDKVIIIGKYVTDADTEETITLRTALARETGKSLFVKLDIEGAEVDVLKGSKEFLSNNHNIKLACCTYHRHDDERNVISLVKEMGFEYELSDGYMYNIWDEKDMRYPYFRHVLLRGWKD